MKYAYYLSVALSLLVCGSSCSSQSSSPYSPEAGVYTGGTTNVTANVTYLYNPITGFGAQTGTSVTPGVNLLGDMIITNSGNNRGTYSFSKLKEWKGDWLYDESKDKLTFTGPLKDALRYYHAGKGAYNITLLIKAKAGDNDGVNYFFSKPATKEFPKPLKPNGDLKGTFTVKPDLNTIGYLDAATATIQKSFNGKTALTNNHHYTIAIGFTDNTRYYQINVTDPSGNTKQYTSSQIMAYNWSFSNYQFGILSEDQSKMALLGKTPDSYLNLTYTPGYFAVGVFEINGRTLGMFRVEDNKYVIPAFLPDGRLVYCPQNGGIAVTDENYKSSSTIYSNAVNAFAVSPDGKQIAFCEGVHFYTMNIDGSNKKQVVCNGQNLEADNADNVITMAWSPDGKHFAVSYKTGGKYSILVVLVDGSNYRFLRDEYGELYQHSGQLISWH